MYERWRNRSDRAVLTISVDDHPAIAQAFMKENGYSFPAICDADIAQKFGGARWPWALLIDPQGRRLQRRAPRVSEETIAEIEETADKIAMK